MENRYKKHGAELYFAKRIVAFEVWTTKRHLWILGFAVLLNLSNCVQLTSSESPKINLTFWGVVLGIIVMFAMFYVVVVYGLTGTDKLLKWAHKKVKDC